jgi:hypothetical protein
MVAAVKQSILRMARDNRDGSGIRGRLLRASRNHVWHLLQDVMLQLDLAGVAGDVHRDERDPVLRDGVMVM